MAGAVALVVGTTAAAVACGDTTTNNVTTVVVAAEGGAEASPSADADAGVDGDVRDARVDDAAGDAADAAVDAPYDGPGCANDQSPTSDRCEIDGMCSAAECNSKNALRVSCFDRDGGTRPPVDGCKFIAHLNAGTSYAADSWCCAPACVPYYESACGAFNDGYTCPNLGDAGGVTIVPSANGCYPVGGAGGPVGGPEGPSRAYCCPK
jgi:hypothetical protein